MFGPNKAGRREQRENFLRPRRAAQQFVERTVRRHAFTTFARENQQAAGLDDARAGAHALHALVKIHVERIAAVRRDHDVERRADFLHRRFADELDAGVVRLEQVAREDAGDLPLVVECDVQQKARAEAQRDVAHLLPDRIALGDAEDRVRVADIFRAVIAHHGFEMCHARHDALGPAAESGEEMRLDEPGDDPHVRVRQMPVDQRGHTRLRDAELFVRRGIFRLVIQHAVVRHDLGREHLLQLRLRVGPVRAERVEQRDLFARNVREMFEQPGNEPVVRCRARDVGENDADLRARLDPVAQWFRSDRIFERLKNRRALILQARRVRRRDHRRLPLGQLDGQLALAVGEIHFHGSNRCELSASDLTQNVPECQPECSYRTAWVLIPPPPPRCSAISGRLFSKASTHGRENSFP